MRKLLLSAAALALAAAGGAQAQVKHIGDPKAFIASAVSIPAGSDIMFVSGITPSAATPGGTDYGDTKAQAITIFDKISAILKGEGYGLGDVAMMRIYLVADPAKGGKMDFAGLNEAFKLYFGTADQPNKPARIAMQITQLANPAFLVEIECQAAKTPMKKTPMKKKK